MFKLEYHENQRSITLKNHVWYKPAFIISD